jgi:hypothetical protein
MRSLRYALLEPCACSLMGPFVHIHTNTVTSPLTSSYSHGRTFRCPFSNDPSFLDPQKRVPDNEPTQSFSEDC